MTTQTTDTMLRAKQLSQQSVTNRRHRTSACFGLAGEQASLLSCVGRAAEAQRYAASY
jgi:hypothetical protein